jgi:hypothetical protein
MNRFRIVCCGSTDIVITPSNIGARSRLRSVIGLCGRKDGSEHVRGAKFDIAISPGSFLNGNWRTGDECHATLILDPGGDIHCSYPVRLVDSCEARVSGRKYESLRVYGSSINRGRHMGIDCSDTCCWGLYPFAQRLRCISGHRYNQCRNIGCAVRFGF